MEEEKRKAYSEVVEILKLIEDEKRLEKIPFEVIQLIKANSDPSYKPNISKEIPLEEQNLKDETYNIIGWIANKYWEENICEDIEEELEVSNIVEDKVEEIEQFAETKEEDQQENIAPTIRNAAVYNDIEPECLEINDKLPMLVSDIKWYERIKIQVIKILKLIFRIKTAKDDAKEN